MLESSLIFLFREIELFPSLVEQCLPSEAHILMESLREECIAPYVDATSRFGSAELRKGLQGRGRVSPASAAVAVPLMFPKDKK